MVVNATHQASLRCLRKFSNYRCHPKQHADLNSLRIWKDIGTMDNNIVVLKEVFIQPFTESELILISGGTFATEKIKDILLNAHSYRKMQLRDSSIFLAK